MRRIDRRIVIIASLVFIIGLAYGLMRFLIAMKEDPATRPPLEVRRYVRAESVVYKTIVSPVSSPGRLSSVSEIDVISEAAGKIITTDIPLKKGSEFSKGDVLFTIYPDEVALALRARKSQFLNILANLLPDISIDFPQHEQSLHNFFSSIDLDKKMPPFPDIPDEKLKIFLTSRNVLGEYYNIQKDELQLGRHTIRAPFDGTYNEVYLEAGAYTNTGGRVAHAIRTDLLELDVPLERYDADWVKVGDEVIIHSDRRAFTWTGKVVRKNQFVDPNTQQQGVFIQVNNHKEVPLLSGEYLTVSFPGHPIESVMEVPRNVVFNTNEVFVIVDGRLKKQFINIVKVNENSYLINGLTEGSILVMQPLINVQEGILVEIQGAQPDDPGNTGGMPSQNPSAEKKQ